MKNVNLRYLAEAAGVIGIIASLVFVGMQLRLESRIAQGEQYTNTLNFRQATLLATLESEVALRVRSAPFENGLKPNWWREGDPELFPEAFVYYEILMSLELINYDNMLYQYNLGLLPEAQWLLYRDVLEGSLRYSPMRQAFFTNPVPQLGMLSIFQLIDEIQAAIDNE